MLYAPGVHPESLTRAPIWKTQKVHTTVKNPLAEAIDEMTPVPAGVVCVPGMYPSGVPVTVSGTHAVGHEYVDVNVKVVDVGVEHT